MAQTVSLTALQASIARALAHAPLDRSRIERAAALIAFGSVHQLDASTFAVRSLTDAATTYTVQPDACECVARVHFPERRCSHEWAARILLSAEREQAARAHSCADRVALAFASARRAA